MILFTLLWGAGDPTAQLIPGNFDKSVWMERKEAVNSVDRGDILALATRANRGDREALYQLISIKKAVEHYQKEPLFGTFAKKIAGESADLGQIDWNKLVRAVFPPARVGNANSDAKRIVESVQRGEIDTLVVRAERGDRAAFDRLISIREAVDFFEPQVRGQGGGFDRRIAAEADDLARVNWGRLGAQFNPPRPAAPVVAPPAALHPVPMGARPSAQDLIQVFENTQAFIKRNRIRPYRVLELIYSGQFTPPPNQSSRPRIQIINADSFEAATVFDNPLVLDMANKNHPGGMVEKGAPAQEEELARRSTLYNALKDIERQFGRYEIPVDGAVYASGIQVLKEPMTYRLLPTPKEVAVVAVAAFRYPGENRLRKKIEKAAARFGRSIKIEKVIKDAFDREILDSTRKQRIHTSTGTFDVPAVNQPVYEKLTKEKIRLIFQIAIHYGHRNLVLGALGTGAFNNPPDQIAKAMAECLNDYSGYFDNVVFAIYGNDSSSRELRRIFEAAFS